MGLSSQLAPSAIAKPGVIANAAARPASPYDGQVIYQQDTDQAYVWNGSAWVLLSTGTANPPGLEFIKSQTVGSAVTTVTVSDVFSSSYDSYKIFVSGGSGSTSMVLKMALGSTATGYYYSFMYLNYGSNTVNGEQSTAATGWTYAGECSADGCSADITLVNPYLSKRSVIYSSIGFGGGAGYAGTQQGMLNNTTSYTSFTLTPNTGNWTGATIKVYGLKN